MATPVNDAPTVILDARHLHSGIGTYALSLLRRLPAAGPHIDYVALVRQTDGDLPKHANLRYRQCDTGIYTLGEQLMVPWHARGGRRSVFHAVHYNFPVLYRGPLVVTIHDLTHLTFPEFLPGRFADVYAKVMLRRGVARAQRIITVSEFTRQQVISLLHASPSKVTAIWSGIDTDPEPGSHTPLPAALAGAPYLLYVGNLKPHKNLDRLFQAFAHARRKNGWAHRLVIAGAGDVDFWKRKIPAGEDSHIVFLGTVKRRLLWSLYRGADLFVMPSLSEGFGFPALEALSCGAIVAAAEASSLPEVLGDAAVYFDPRSTDDMEHAITRGVCEQDLRQRLRVAGREQVKRFCWLRSAQQHLDVYRDVLGI